MWKVELKHRPLRQGEKDVDETVKVNWKVRNLGDWLRSFRVGPKEFGAQILKEMEAAGTTLRFGMTYWRYDGVLSPHDLYFSFCDSRDWSLARVEIKLGQVTIGPKNIQGFQEMLVADEERQRLWTIAYKPEEEVTFEISLTRRKVLPDTLKEMARESQRKCKRRRNSV